MALRADEVVMPGGRTARREIIEHPGAVAIAALDPDDRIMMIYQYRHALGRRLWEMPAGLLDVAGEDPLETARRELREEAGLEAAEWAVLLDVAPSPGFSDESVRVFLARGLTEVERPELGDDEEADLTTRWVTLSVAVRMVLAGTIVNGVTAAAVLAAQRRSGLARGPAPAGRPLAGPAHPLRGARQSGDPCLGSDACASDCSSPKAGGTTSSASSPPTSGG